MVKTLKYVMCRNNHVAVAVERRTQLDVGTLGRIGGIFKIDVYLLALHSRCNVANVISTAVLLFLGSSLRQCGVMKVSARARGSIVRITGSRKPKVEKFSPTVIAREGTTLTMARCKHITRFIRIDTAKLLRNYPPTRGYQNSEPIDLMKDSQNMAFLSARCNEWMLCLYNNIYNGLYRTTDSFRFHPVNTERAWSRYFKSW